LGFHGATAFQISGCPCVVKTSAELLFSSAGNYFFRAMPNLMGADPASVMVREWLRFSTAFQPNARSA
jgi:hypothetical protein